MSLHENLFFLLRSGAGRRRRHRRRLRAAALAFAVAAPTGLASGAAADSRLAVTGPSSVRVGERVMFVAQGLHRGERVAVSVAPTRNRGGNCCGIDVVRSARPDSDGTVRLRFRWPSHYFKGAERARWRHGVRADVIVFSDHGRGLRVVRVKRR